MNEVLAITLQSMQIDMAKVDRVALNLANAQTAGYKREVLAPAAFSHSIAAASGQAALHGPAPMAVQVDQRPGTLRSTGGTLDVALTGPGWFEVQTDSGIAYTRQGNFHLDAQGRLVTQAGQPVLGVSGEIQLPHDHPVIDAQGRVFEGNLPGGAPAVGSQQPIAQLKVVQFEDKAPVQRLGNGLVAVTGEVLAAPDGSTEVRQGYLENSNVSSMQEMLQLMQTMRHFESMQKTAMGYDDLLGTAIRKLGDTT